jgi:hypothetical protein
MAMGKLKHIEFQNDTVPPTLRETTRQNEVAEK